MVGCSTKNTYSGPYPPDKLGTIGAKINENPSQMTSVLEEYGLTRKEFERAVRTVSNHPELSEQYRSAFNKYTSDSK